jgi:signal transduction histidine kinase
MKINKLSAVRLAYIFTLLFLLLGTCVTLSLGYEMRSVFMRQINENLTSEVTEAYGNNVGLHDVAHLAPNVKIFTLTDREYHYLLQDSQGHAIAGNLSPLPPVAGFRWIEDPGADSGHSQRLYGLGIKLVDGGYYFVAHDTTSIDTLRNSILETALIGSAAFLLCGLGGGVFMGALVRRRLIVIGQTLQDIKKGDLTARLPVASGRDELDDLCEMFNDVLKQNELLIEKIRQVSNNIAHDMRTPLTRLRHRLQRVVSGPQDDVQSETQLAIGDLDVSLEIFSSLLQLAEIEAICDPRTFSYVDLSDEVEGSKNL